MIAQRIHLPTVAWGFVIGFPLAYFAQALVTALAR